MDTLNPLFAVIAFLIAAGTAYLINLRYKISDVTSRFEGIDSLRGFLAIGVFIHHSSVWYQFIQINKWQKPNSNLYNHLGETSVAFFFMITSFLFMTKLLNAREKGFNWSSFFVSRIFRLGPMYYVSIVVVFLMAFAVGGWKLHASPVQIITSMFHWGVFTITTEAPINNFELTKQLNAGVIWSLPYEWLFYFSLPILALVLLKKRPPVVYLLMALVFITGYTIYHGFVLNYTLSFASGAIAPFIIKYGPAKVNVKSPFFAVVIAVCLYFVGQFGTSDDLVCKLLLTIIFTLIAMGNTFFGILKSSTLKFMGEICYSTYLVHGILLFIVIYFYFGLERVKQLSPTEYCIVIFALTPLVIMLSYLGFRFIEKPFMRKELQEKVSSKLQSLLG